MYWIWTDWINMNKNFAILELYCGDSGKIGFYNSQELGICKAMRKRGYNCFVFYPDAGISERVEDVRDDIRIIRCPAKKIGVHGFYDLNVLKQYKIDYVQIDSDNQLYAPNVIRYCLKNGIPFYNYMGTIASDSDNGLKKIVSEFLMKRNIRMYQRSKCFVKTKDVLRSVESAGITNASIVHVGLDFSLIPEISEGQTAIRKSLSLPEDKKILLFVGRMDPYKRPMQMIEVMTKLDDSFFGVMIGTGSLNSEVDEAIEKELHGRAIRIDRIENKRIHQFYKAADYFLNFNEKEIFGMSMLEAMYQGCNVVAISSPGAREIIDEESGFVTEDLGGMLKIIEKDYKKDSKTIKERILKDFSWDHSVSYFDSYLNS